MLTVYDTERSGNSYKARLMLGLLGLDYTKHPVDLASIDGGEILLRHVVGCAAQGHDALLHRDLGGGGTDVGLHKQPAANLEGHPRIRFFGIGGLDLDFVFDARDAGKIFHGVRGERCLVGVLHRAGERDDAVVRFHLHVVFKDGAVVVGSLGRLLDFAVSGGRGKDGGGAGEKE